MMEAQAKEITPPGRVDMVLPECRGNVPSLLQLGEVLTAQQA